MINENFTLTGRFQLYEDDKLVIDKSNLITNLGAELYANIISGDISILPEYLGIDGGSGEYTHNTTQLFNEILRKYQANVTSPGNLSKREFIIDSNEAIGQIYGFGLTTSSTLGIYTNLINQNYLHEAGKKLRIVWTIEVSV